MGLFVRGGGLDPLFLPPPFLPQRTQIQPRHADKEEDRGEEAAEAAGIIIIELTVGPGKKRKAEEIISWQDGRLGGCAR